MHEIARPVGVLLLVDRAVRANEEPRPRGHQRALQDHLIQPVDVHLRLLAHVDVAEARGRIRLHKLRVEHEGIQPVVVISAQAVPLVVLRRVQKVPAHELRVVHHRAPAAPALVIPVHHHAALAGLRRGGQRAVRQRRAVQPPPEKRPAVDQRLVGHALHVEHVPRGLQTAHARLPVQAQKLDLSNVDVAQPVRAVRVPEHAGHARAALELRPPYVGIHLLVFVQLHHHGQDGAERLRVGRVAFLARQHIRLRHVVHRVGVLVRDAVQKPRARGLRVAGIAPHRRPVPQPVPLFVFQ